MEQTQDNKLTWILVVMGAGGIAGSFLVYLWLRDHENWKFILDAICAGAIVASILGLTVDRLLKKELLDNVFRATFGYILPEELRPSLEWLYKQTFICTNHNQTIKLDKVNDRHLLSMTVDVHRTFKNISNRTQELTVSLGVDEWFHSPVESGVVEFGYESNGEFHNVLTEGKFEKDRFRIHLKPFQLSVKSKDCIHVWMKWREIKQINDSSAFLYHYPTAHPRVVCEVPTGTEIDVNFHSDRAAAKKHSNTFCLEDTLVPMQAINVRWWKKEDSEKWMATTNPSV